MDIEHRIPDGLKTAHWQGYAPATDPAQAVAGYTARYGQPPAHIIAAPNNLLIGPIPASGPTQRPLGEV